MSKGEVRQLRLVRREGLPGHGWTHWGRQEFGFKASVPIGRSVLMEVCVSDSAIDRGNAYTNDGGLAPIGSSGFVHSPTTDEVRTFDGRTVHRKYALQVDAASLGRRHSDVNK